MRRCSSTPTRSPMPVGSRIRPRSEFMYRYLAMARGAFEFPFHPGMSLNLAIASPGSRAFDRDSL